MSFNTHSTEDKYKNRDKKLKTFPDVEFLPITYTVKEVKKPAPAKKGEITYKKITLDHRLLRLGPLYIM